MRRPEARDVTVEQIALDGLAEASGAARAVDFPSWREDERAAEWNVRAWRAAWSARSTLLKSDHIVLECCFDALRFLVDRFQMSHSFPRAGKADPSLRSG